MKIPFSPPYIDQDIINEVVDTMKSGWITTGPKVKAFEDEISKFTDVDNTLCVNSWTSGAILVLKWFGVKKGDEVIVPAYTYCATALAVIRCGATPVMVDVKEDFTIDIDKIEASITERTKVIIPVDIAGLPCHYKELHDLVNNKKIKSKFSPDSENQHKLGRILLLADAAHSFGANYEKLRTGKLTDITVFSFHAVKNVTTAEGGAISLNLPAPFQNAEEYRVLRLWTLNGQTKDAFTKSQGGGNSWQYDIVFPGLKINMPDLCAAMGLAQIRKYSGQILPERIRVGERYQAFFNNKPWAQLPILKDDQRTSSYHLYPLKIRNISEGQRNEIINEIADKGVSVNVHFIPMPMLTLFKDLGYKMEDYPVSYDIYSREISLPIYPELKDDQVDFICKVVEESYERVIGNETNI